MLWWLRSPPSVCPHPAPPPRRVARVTLFSPAGGGGGEGEGKYQQTGNSAIPTRARCRRRPELMRKRGPVVLAGSQVLLWYHLTRQIWIYQCVRSTPHRGSRQKWGRLDQTRKIMMMFWDALPVIQAPHLTVPSIPGDL